MESLTTGNLWLSILSLSQSGPIYAYKLPDDIHARFGFRPSRLMVYLVLYKLEGEGLLRSSEKGQRRYYTLTPDGKRCLSEGRAMLKAKAGAI
ncbi:MAG: helix-turn-helix transcriptional regulator [Candidatus Micrarchaeota archaeon]|nr:helix-turn-helix transcriptional regulator [Candidatus Micrarchaeota archaeon]